MSNVVPFRPETVVRVEMIDPLEFAASRISEHLDDFLAAAHLTADADEVRRIGLLLKEIAVHAAVTQTAVDDRETRIRQAS